MGGDDGHTLSIIIPTYNERANIEPLFREFARLKKKLSIPVKIHIVDDGSPDGTRKAALELGKQYGLQVHVHLRSGSRGLGGAIVAGLGLCDSDLVCVMDADLSHPPSMIPAMVESLNGSDGVVASRYVPGAKIESWPLMRHLISYVATAIARSTLRVQCRDPLSGFFLFRRSFLDQVCITGDGNKPLLEVLVGARPVVNEVPYQFRNRKNGESKLTAGNIADFLRLVFLLQSGFQIRAKTPLPFGSRKPQPRKP